MSHQFLHAAKAAFLASLLCAGSQLHAQADRCQAQPSDISPSNENAIHWAETHLEAHKEALAWARAKHSPNPPTPPDFDPPCQQCGENAKTVQELKTDEWIKESMKPESDYLHTLTSDEHTVGMWQCQKFQFSGPAERALEPFNQGEANDAITEISNEIINNKLEPMFRRFHQDPKKAYAGIALLSSVYRELTLLNPSGSAASGPDTALSEAKEWYGVVVQHINDDMFKGHRYNLCPGYALMIRDAELMGAEATNMAEFTSTLQKIQKFLHFHITAGLYVTVQGTDGSHLKATWVGQSDLNLTIPHVGCYTPEIENDGVMKFGLLSWDMVGIKHTDHGDETVNVAYSSPRTFNAKFKLAPQINLCDPQPILQIPFSSLDVPSEKITADGHTQETKLLGPFLSAVVVPQEINTRAANAVTGGANKLPSDSQAADEKPDSSSMNEAKAKLEAHQSDIAWLMGPEGQAAIQQIQQSALQMTKSAMKKSGMVFPDAGNFKDLAGAVSSAHLNWSNGQTQPVNQTFHVTKDGTTIQLNITVDHVDQP